MGGGNRVGRFPLGPAKDGDHHGVYRKDAWWTWGSMCKGTPIKIHTWVCVVARLFGLVSTTPFDPLAAFKRPETGGHYYEQHSVVARVRSVVRRNGNGDKGSDIPIHMELEGIGRRGLTPGISLSFTVSSLGRRLEKWPSLAMELVLLFQ